MAVTDVEGLERARNAVDAAIKLDLQRFAVATFNAGCESDALDHLVDAFQHYSQAANVAAQVREYGTYKTVKASEYGTYKTVNMAHTRQSRPYSGLGVQVKLLTTFYSSKQRVGMRGDN